MGTQPRQTAEHQRLLAEGTVNKLGIGAWDAEPGLQATVGVWKATDSQGPPPAELIGSWVNTFVEGMQHKVQG